MTHRIFLSVFFILCASCATVTYVSDTSVSYSRVSNETGEKDAALNELIEPYREELSESMDKVIGHLSVEMIKQRPESNIGNWLADMLYDEALAANNGILDFAVQNQGGIRVNGLGAGPLTIGEMYEVMPFDNLVTIISANGRITQEFLDHIAKGRGWPVSKNLSFQIRDEKAVEVLLNGQSLDPDRIYHFALPDYIASGGSGSTMLADGIRKDLNILVRDAFINHIKKDTSEGIDQEASIEGRVKFQVDE